MRPQFHHSSHHSPSQFPYLCPGGFYRQLWDWDAVFAGIGALPFGSAPYLCGSMKNFFSSTDAAGRVPGCLTPAGPSSTLAHAKPVLIWGALLGARATGDFEQFREFLPSMEALLAFWERERRDAATGLFVWHDQMESGADDLPLSEVPSAHTASWSAALHGNATASPDVHTFLVRERRALAAFLRVWAGAEAGGGAGAALLARAEEHAAAAEAVVACMQARLWHWEGAAGAEGRRGWWRAWDAKRSAPAPARTYQLAWPAWEGIGAPEQVAACLAEVLAPDLRGAAGIRSTSAADPRYSLEDAIVPYSIWRGPVWVNINCCLCYALARGGRRAEALEVARGLVDALAADIRACGAMHECYSPDTGAPTCTASKGFLSWNMMAAHLIENLEAGVDPTALA